MGVLVQKDGNMKVVSWNVWNRNRRIDLVEGFIRGTNADVLALQELSREHVDAIRGIAGYEFVLADDFVEKGELSHLGLLTRLPVRDANTVTHNAEWATSPSIAGRFMRWQECLQSQSVLLSAGTKEVRVVNIHLSCAVSPRVRAAQLAEVTGHFGSDDAIVLCGDFNSFAKPALNIAIGWAFGFGLPDLMTDEQQRIADFAAAKGMERIFADEITHPRHRLQLDHILTQRLHLIASHVEIECFGSDHRPLVATLGV